MTQIVRKYDKKLYKKCIKCRAWKPRQTLVNDEGRTLKGGFGAHESSSDGLQSICFDCKNVANKVAREKNVTARIRHHMATRCLTQLGDLAPEGFTANIEQYLGYKITKLVKHLSRDLKEREGKDRKLRDALNEGYHIDHIRPLSSFDVVVDTTVRPRVQWDEFQRCWAIDNLSAITGAENLAKGAKYDADPDASAGT